MLDCLRLTRRRWLIPTCSQKKSVSRGRDVYHASSADKPSLTLSGSYPRTSAMPLTRRSLPQDGFAKSASLISRRTFNFRTPLGGAIYGKSSGITEENPSPQG